eukprot:1678070-Rhodomonas_salina.2
MRKGIETGSAGSSAMRKGIDTASRACRPPPASPTPIWHSLSHAAYFSTAHRVLGPSQEQLVWQYRTAHSTVQHGSAC